MDWTFTDQRPIYAQLIEQAQRAVVTGQWLPGSKLPGVRELAAQAGVNPNTMQRALAELESGGLVKAQRTSGRFVTEDTAHIALLRKQLAAGLARRFVGSMGALGCGPEESAALVAEAWQNGENTKKEELT